MEKGVVVGEPFGTDRKTKQLGAGVGIELGVCRIGTVIEPVIFWETKSFDVIYIYTI